MLIDQLWLKPTEMILDRIADMANLNKQSDGAQTEKAPAFRVRCPGCGSIVLSRELLVTGCYVCGWSPADPEHEPEPKKLQYRVPCPGCGATVVREQLVETGCYLCGWQPADGDAAKQ